MIITEKQIDDNLMEKLLAQGFTVWIEDGKLFSTDDDAVQAIINAYSLAEAKASACANVAALAKTKRDAVISGISVGEMAGWPIKLAEAQAYRQSGDPEVAPMLSSEAASRGVSLTDLVDKVEGNAQTFAGLEAAIAGTDGRHRDAIVALTDWRSLYAYDYTVGWPV